MMRFKFNIFEEKIYYNETEVIRGDHFITSSK